MMDEVKLTRAQRRQMQKLADKVDRITQADRRFFERFPHREHRIRLASQAEIEQNTLLDGKPPWIPQDFRLYTIVRNIAPGTRMRLFLPAPEGRETDVSETTARAVWDAVETPQVRDIEAQMRAGAT